MAISQKESKLTEKEAQVAVACKWLRRGFSALAGGEKLAAWLEKNRDNIDGIFGDDDQVFIKVSNKETNKELLEFILREGIGDERKYIKWKGDERWWLQIWWD